MVETRAHFAHRLKKLGRKHDMMTRGYVNVLTRDGLIVARPVQQRSPVSGLKLIMLAVSVFFLFKAVALTSIGPEAYADRLSVLHNGTTAEQIGGKLMAADELTRAIATLISPLLG